jgi:hypothetical protein
MKNSMKKILAVTLAAFVLAVSDVQAQAPLTDLNFINVALTIQSQSGYKDNGTIRIYFNPGRQKFSTKNLLSQLALDEYALTNYPANDFPSGARLAVNGANGAVVVVNGSNQLLVDVSNIMSFSSGTNGVLTGRVSNATGLARPSTAETIYVSLNFDDTFIPGGGGFVPGGNNFGNLKFFVAGLDTLKTSDSVPGSGGGYHENTSDFVKSGAGSGQFGGVPIVVTGLIQGGRSVNLNTGNIAN